MTSLGQSRETSEFRSRYRFIAISACVVFGIIGLRLAQVQLLQHDEWAQRAARNTTKTITLPSVRGVIRDRNGEIIAGNRLAYDLIVTPKLFKDPEKIENFIALLGLDAQGAEKFRNKLATLPERRRDRQLTMLRDISRDQLAAIETHLMEYPGIDVVTSSQRYYPYNHLGAHLIGYMGEVTADDLAKLGQDYSAGDRVGRTGIEWKLESLLRGHEGFRRELVDAKGQRLAWDGEVDARDAFKEPVTGSTVQLSIDIGLMRDLDKFFEPYPAGGAAVVNVRTGEILALYSKPAYDSNAMGAGLSSERYKAMLDDPNRPLIDRGIYETYYPGSIFKPFTTFVGLKRGVIRPNTNVTCHKRYTFGRQVMLCNSNHGNVHLHEALVRSCNVFFWEAAQKLDIDDIDQMAADFGFGTKVGLGFQSESSGFLARRAWYQKKFGAFTPGFTLNTAIGQGNTRVTVLQAALAYAAIANEGTLWNPTLIHSIFKPDGTVDHQPATVRRQIKLPQDYWNKVKSALVDVVNRPDGTASGALTEKLVRMAGKTGTAEVIKRTVRDAQGDPHFYRSHGWFGGYAPADNPEIAIAVVVDHGGSGGHSAAPIALHAMQNYLTSKNKERHDSKQQIQH